MHAFHFKLSLFRASARLGLHIRSTVVRLNFPRDMIRIGIRSALNI